MASAKAGANDTGSHSSNSGTDSIKPFKFDNKSLPVRKNTNQTGTAANVHVNSFQALFKPTDANFAIYQYDVKMYLAKDWDNPSKSEADISRKVREKVWQTNAVNQAIGQYALFNGDKIAWALEKKDPGPVRVDLNVESGRPPSKPTSKNNFICYITFTRKVDFKPLLDLLNGVTSSGAAVVGPADWSMALNMIDHALHQNAKRNAILVKKSVFPPNSGSNMSNYLKNAVIAYRGIYLTAKAAFNGFNGTKPVRALTINVDATCVAFWRGGPLLQVAYQFLDFENEQALESKFGQEAKGKSDAQWAASNLCRNLMKLKNVKVVAMHLRKDGQQDKIHSIQKFLGKPPVAYSFEVEGSNGGIPAGKYTIAQYFEKKYPNHRMKMGILPCVDLGGGGIMPMEALQVLPHQKYMHKLTGLQTTAMLNLAAQLPQLRQQAITQGVAAMNWGADPWLKGFGIRANPASMIKTIARVLPAPELEWKDKKRIGQDKTRQGRWMIPNLKFVRSNGDARMPITSWACFVIKSPRGPAVSLDGAKNFLQTFRQVYNSHGGVFNAPGMPHLYIHTIQDMGDKIAECIDQTTKVFKGQKPQLVIFIVPDQSPEVYNVIKKNMDCRFGIASQVCWTKHVLQNKPQYHSNVALKVNAKLGGSTTYARSKTPLVDQGGFYKPEERVMVIGADVTHGAPGGDQNSIACLVMSKDHTLTNYMGAVAVNGLRQDIIHKDAMEDLFGTQLKAWMRLNGNKLPKRILYFRDGVAREMSKKVLDEEVAQVKRCLITHTVSNSAGGADAAASIKFTVVIATKRHHTRIFPEKGDRNGNCLPGTLVDTHATGAVDLDWYMVSHIALKGTARPMHYNVILDENNYKMEALQQYIHESTFQYVRSTTSVSMHPAVYYAHLASKRGVIHETRQVSAQSGGKKEIDARRLAGMSDREAVQDYRMQRDQDRDRLGLLGHVEIDPVAGQLKEHMWFC